MDGDRLPRRILRDAGLRVLPGELRPREGVAVRVDWQGTQAVLRSVPGGAGTPSARLTDDIEWLHAFLGQLTLLDFPAPRPLPAFGGRSWTTGHGALWEIVSFLPGRSIGWAAQPPMEEIGALLARYHATAAQTGVTGQRPTALPLSEVPAVLLSARLEALGVHPQVATSIRRLAEQLARDLSQAHPLTGKRVVIHGDFTNDNVIASGEPPKATGVIDFALAHVEVPMADIGYALWRSGRPHEYADHLDLSRVRRYMHGYTTVATVSAADVRIIPLYLTGRGLQMIAKRVRAGRPDISMLAQVLWLSANAPVIGDVLAASLP